MANHQNLQELSKAFFQGGVWTTKEIEERLWEMLESAVGDEITCSLGQNKTYMCLYKDLVSLLTELEKYQNQ